MHITMKEYTAIQGYTRIKWDSNYTLRFPATITFANDINAEYSTLKNALKFNPHANHKHNYTVNSLTAHLIHEAQNTSTYSANEMKDDRTAIHLVPNFLEFVVKRQLLKQFNDKLTPIYSYNTETYNAQEFYEDMLKSMVTLDNQCISIDMIDEEELCDFHPSLTAEKFRKAYTLASDYADLDSLVKFYTLETIQDVTRIFHEYYIAEKQNPLYDSFVMCCHRNKQEQTGDDDIPEKLKRAFDNAFISSQKAHIAKKKEDIHSNPRKRYIHVADIAAEDEFEYLYYQHSIDFVKRNKIRQ